MPKKTDLHTIDSPTKESDYKMPSTSKQAHAMEDCEVSRGFQFVRDNNVRRSSSLSKPPAVFVDIKGKARCQRKRTEEEKASIATAPPILEAQLCAKGRPKPNS